MWEQADKGDDTHRELQLPMAGRCSDECLVLYLIAATPIQCRVRATHAQVRDLACQHQGVYNLITSRNCRYLLRPTMLKGGSIAPHPPSDFGGGTPLPVAKRQTFALAGGDMLATACPLGALASCF